jgi:fructokinase
MSTIDITVLGELLIDFTQSGHNQSGMALFERNPGGAVANVAVAASRLGHSSAFIGKVGNDMHGRFLAQTLEQYNVNTSGLVYSDSEFTTLAFVALDENGERSFSFARKPGADTCLKAEELNVPLITGSRIFHIGSLSLTAEPSRSATFAALKLAKSAGAIISYDPNYRSTLWPDENAAIEHMRSVLPYIDIMKLSDNETELLTGLADPSAAALALNAMGIACVAVTLGSSGALVCTKGKTDLVPPCTVQNVVDTTGAGDAFWGGFLSAFLDSGLSLDKLELDQASAFARYGNATAVCCIQCRGAIPAMPDKSRLNAYL